MNAATSYFRLVAGLAMLLAAASSAPAAAQCFDGWWWPPQEQRIDPQPPTSREPVRITMGGVWPNTCTPNASAVSRRDNRVFFDAIQSYPDCNRFCAQVLTPWEQMQSIALPPGEYELHVRQIDLPCSPEPCLSTFVGRFRVYGPGDMNCDGVINSADIEGFILALFDPDGYEQQYPDCDVNLADMNGDGMVNAGDIEGFIAALFE